jgi:hypothetical protein
MKDCCACGKRLELSEFYVNKASNDGFTARCKTCLRVYQQERRYRLRASKPADWKQKTKDMTAYRKAWAKANPGYMTAKKREWWSRNKDRLKVKYAVRYAIKTGKLVRQPCVVCGNPESHGHHEDYSKPLDVIWLCRTHHTEHHVANRANHG